MRLSGVIVGSWLQHFSQLHFFSIGVLHRCGKKKSVTICLSDDQIVYAVVFKAMWELYFCMASCLLVPIK